MMITRRLLCVLLAITACACSPKRRGNGNGDDDDGSSGSNGSGACADTCSADNTQVLDCNGNVVQTCAADLPCSGGACEDACTAANNNTSSVGCDYYAVNPDSYFSTNGACFAVYLANTSAQPASIAVEYNGQSLPIDGFARIPTGQGLGLTYAPLPNDMLPPNQVAILFLAYSIGLGTPCPSGITAAYTTGDAAVHGTALGQAFHITTTQPVVAYDIFPYGGGTSAVTSATLLLPTPAWDSNYVAVDAYAQSTVAGQPFTEIVAKQDSTSVTIRPIAAITGGTGVAAAAANAPTTYALNAGQVLQFTQNAELAGSPITATVPVGVWGGASCMNIPVSQTYCDAAHQEIPPVRAMGNHYAAVRYRNRFTGQEETVPWRMVGGVDGTTLTYLPSTPTGAPTTLALGQVAEFDAPGPFVVASQDAAHPFYMSAHMTGCTQVSTSDDDCRGDPEFVNIVPPEQYLSSYTFFTDPTYPETDLVLTRAKQNNAFADVTIDCVGTVTGWQPIDTADTIEYTRVDLVTGDFQGVGNCNNGLHIANSSQPFGLVVWGWGSGATGLFNSTAVSYAYPAGANIQHINNIVIQ
jgi:hypothetical protein